MRSKKLEEYKFELEEYLLELISGGPQKYEEIRQYFNYEDYELLNGNLRKLAEKLEVPELVIRAWQSYGSRHLNLSFGRSMISASEANLVHSLIERSYIEGQLSVLMTYVMKDKDNLVLIRKSMEEKNSKAYNLLMKMEKTHH